MKSFEAMFAEDIDFQITSQAGDRHGLSSKDVRCGRTRVASGDIDFGLRTCASTEGGQDTGASGARAIYRFAGGDIEQRSKGTPKPSLLKISSTRKWILNGRLIENKGTWSPGNVEFLHLMTYDPKRREYRQ